jgi:L-threonylcarbamoyladenylate synthase
VILEAPTTMPSADELSAAAAVLQRGGLVAFPTETVYGLGADATNAAAVRRIFLAKGRPEDHPLIVHIGEASSASRYAMEVPTAAHRLAERFWPGPLTLILRKSERVPDAVTGGQITVGLRVPAHPIALALLHAFGGAIAAPSANKFGLVSPTTAAHVREDLGDSVDVVLDGGACAVGIESTIVDLTSQFPRILRLGGVTQEDLEDALGQRLSHVTQASVRAPGMLRSHYAPRARVVLAQRDTVRQEVAALESSGLYVAVLAGEELELPPSVALLPLPGEASEAARVLYDRLREVDRLGYGAVVVVPPAEVGLGRAIADRLSKAAAPRD